MGTVTFSRGLFGRSPESAARRADPARPVAVGQAQDNIMTLSGGMKRRVMIAKALAHEPEILFLDEPTAGVDVELRRDMWDLVRRLRENGATIILTTHYIEEAEEMADRVGVINKGELILRGEKRADEEAREEAAHAAAEEPLTAFRTSCGVAAELKREGHELDTRSTSSGAHGHPVAAVGDRRRWGSDSRTSTRSRARSRTSS